MSRPKITFDIPKTAFEVDAIQSSEPSYLEALVKLSELKRRLKLDLAKKEARDLYRRDNIYKTGVMNMSDEEIDNILLLQSQLPKLVQDNRTNQQREEAKKAFKHQEELLELEKQIDQADAVMSVSTDYIPVIGSLLRAGQYNLTRDTYSPKYARNKYGVMPAFGAALDLATLPFGLATKSLASSYAGGMVGRYIGDEYYDNPFVGLFIGTLLGHPTHNIATKTADKANRAYLGYRLGRAMNNGVDNTQLINLPVEHVSPNGITIGSTLNIGDEGIHLSPVGSSTTPRIELFYLDLGLFPFVRNGILTYSNHTMPVEVLDLGSFKSGFNPDFDAKVANGTTNFIYTNNFEGKGNTSYLTMEPSLGLQLSKNTQNSRINWYAPAIKTFGGLRLVDGTLTPDLRGTLYNYLGLPSKFFNNTSIPNHPEWGNGFSVQKYSQNGRDYYIGENGNRSKVIYSLPGESDYHMIEPTSELDYWRIIGEIEDAILTSRLSFIESLPDNEIKSLVRSSNINDRREGSVARVSSPESRLTDMLRSKVKEDIENVYLSDKYIDRYMQSLGLDPKSLDLRQQVKSIIANDIYRTYDMSIPKVYVDQPFNGGASITLFKHTPGDKGLFSLKKIPEKHVYGINTNSGPEYLENDWTSILFHEFGHNLWFDTTPFSKYLRNYNKYQIENNFTPLNLTEAAFKPENKDYVKYLQDPNEFRQRIMEGVRYGIKEGLTPEEIYNEYQTTGFAHLKPFFKKDYLIKMLGLMLGTIPMIINSKNNDTIS